MPAYFTMGHRYSKDACYTPEDISSKEDWPFNEPFYIILNLAVGGNLGGTKGNWNKATMEVDYVRVYRDTGKKVKTSGNSVVRYGNSHAPYTSSSSSNSSSSPSTEKTETQFGPNLITTLGQITTEHYAMGIGPDGKWIPADSSFAGNLNEGITAVFTQDTEDRWKSQLRVYTDADIIPDKKWKFTADLESDSDLSNVAVKIGKKDDDGSFILLDYTTQLSEGIKKTVTFTGTSSKEISDLLVLFDIGGNTAATLKVSHLYFGQEI